jgi:DNA-binding IclR family transcriptional regulator
VGKGTALSRDYAVPSVVAAARVLRWLRGRRATLSEVSQALHLSKSSAYGLLKTLQSEGLLAYDDDSRQYRLGVELLALGEAAAEALDHVATVKPLLRAVVTETGLTGLVAQPTRGELLIVHKEEGTAEVRATSSIGRFLPQGAGAMGKAYLAFARTGRTGPSRTPGTTPKSITDPARMLRELEVTRRRGYATSIEEYRLGVSAVAAPVLDHRGEVVLLVSLIGFASDLGPRTIDRVGALLRDTAVKASRAVGAPAPATRLSRSVSRPS